MFLENHNYNFLSPGATFRNPRYASTLDKGPGIFAGIDFTSLFCLCAFPSKLYVYTKPINISMERRNFIKNARLAVAGGGLVHNHR